MNSSTLTSEDEIEYKRNILDENIANGPPFGMDIRNLFISSSYIRKLS